MLFEVLLLLAGMLALIKSSSITINNAAKLSELTGISQVVVGFIFIAVATSLPELSIAFVSSLQGEGLLSVGNLLGANIANMTLVFGVMAFLGFNLGKIYSIRIEQTVLVTSCIAIFMLVLGQAGIVFGLFCILIFYLFSSSVIKEGAPVEAEKETRTFESVKTALVLVAAVVIVVMSAYVVTVNSIELACIFGVAESVVGATILAIGTTLPEMSVNIAAVRKGNIGLAVGDIVGSTITNLTLILGLVAVINPFVIANSTVLILLSLLGVNAMFYIFSLRMAFSYREGIILLVIYAAYLSLVLSYIA